MLELAGRAGPGEEVNLIVSAAQNVDRLRTCIARLYILPGAARSFMQQMPCAVRRVIALRVVDRKEIPR